MVTLKVMMPTAPFFFRVQAVFSNRLGWSYHMAIGPNPAPLVNIDPSHTALPQPPWRGPAVSQLWWGLDQPGSEAKAQPVEGFAGAGELYAMEVRGVGGVGKGATTANSESCVSLWRWIAHGTFHN